MFELLVSLLFLLTASFGTGAIALRQRRRYDQEIARQRGALLEAGKAAQQAADRADRLAALNAIGQTIGSGLELDQVLGAFAVAVKRLLDYDRLSIALLTADEQEMEVVSLTHVGGQAPATVRVPVLNSAQGWVIAQRAPLLRRDLTVEGSFTFDRFSRELGLRAEMVVPLLYGGVVVGALGLASRQEGAYTLRELDTLEQIASHVAIAVENGRIYRQKREMAVVEERNRLAREIHSTIAQHLIALILQLSAARDLLPRGATDLTAELRQAEDLARLSLEEARRSAWGLQPPALESLSLGQAIAKELATVARQAGFASQFAVHGAERPLGMEQEIALFRIAQEAIRNSRKHARASRVEGSLEYGAEAVTLTMRDDGLGFEAEAEMTATPEQAGGYGLISMRERAALLCGALHVESAPSKGTSLRVSIPYKPADQSVCDHCPPYIASRPEPSTLGAPPTSPPDSGASSPDPGEELTQREMEVLRLLAKGARNKEIGHALLISEKTVKFHVANIFQKLGADTRTEAVSFALEKKLL